MTDEPQECEDCSNTIAFDSNQRRWKYCLPVTIEPGIFLFCLSSTLTASVTTNLFLVHTCENSLGFNHTTCKELGDKTSNNSYNLESEVQHEATYFTLGKSMIESFIPAVFSFYLGPWSDSHGRKPLIMWPMLGYAFTYIIFLVDSLFPELPVVILMVSSLPSALSGGFITLLSGSYSYISDVSTSKKRTLRIGMVDVAIFSGLLTGSISASYIYNASELYGYVIVYAVAATCCVLGWLHCFLNVKESIVNNESNHACCCVTTNLFKNHHVTDMFRTCFEKRPNYSRTIILIMLFVLTSCLGTIEGEVAVEFLFTRQKFQWDLHDYTIFAAVTLAMGIIGLFFGTYALSSWLVLPPTLLTTFSIFLKIITSVVKALSPSSWYMYLGSLLNVPGACIGPWCRSILSKSVPNDEIGKVFALLASVEALMPLIVSPLYTLSYNATIWSFPGAFYFLSAGVFTVDLLLLIGAMILQRNRSDDNYPQYFHSPLKEAPCKGRPLPSNTEQLQSAASAVA